MTIDKDHPHEVVKKQYEELMENGMPFLQIFPEISIRKLWLKTL